MPIFAYLFEARSIQQYIFETGKLKDMVGASYIVDYLCKIEGDDLIGSVLKELNLLEGKDIRFSRRAGGSFVGLMRDEIQAKLLRNQWTCWQYCCPIFGGGREKYIIRSLLCCRRCGFRNRAGEQPRSALIVVAVL